MSDILIRLVPLVGIIFLWSCRSVSSPNLFSSDRFGEWRNYEQDFGSRIEQFLDLAKQELKDNFEKKEYLMIRGEQPPQVIHPRKDAGLRELIYLAYEDKKISEDQRDDYERRCDELYELWEKHWSVARRKAKRMGFGE